VLRVLALPPVQVDVHLAALVLPRLRGIVPQAAVALFLREQHFGWNREGRAVARELRRAN